MTKNFVENRHENNFNGNTVMEDWAYNKLDPIDPESDKFIILETEDSKLFSLYYAQNVLGYKPYVHVVSPLLVTYKWYFDKVKMRLDKIVLDEQKIVRNKKFALYKDLIVPNLGNYIFLVEDLGVSLENVTSKFNALGTAILKKTSGNSFYPAMLRKNHRPVISSHDNMLFLNEKKIIAKSCEFYAKYSEYLSDMEFRDEALNRLQMALYYVPFCFKAASKLCSMSFERDKYCLLAVKLKQFEAF